MLEIGVLADDLTGALASAARLRHRGLEPVVVWSQREPPAGADSIVVDMRTRDSGTDAGTIASDWAGFLGSLGCRRLEQRIDSALQGRPAEEIEGALRGAAFADPLVLAVPAFPAAGRRTLGGAQHIELAGEEPRVLDVAGTLFPGAEVARIEIAEVEAGAGAVAASVRRALDGSTRRIVADAVKDRHLETIANAAAVLEANGVELLTASPGAWLLYHPAGATDQESFVLAVVSSPTAQNRAQLDRLGNAPNVVIVETLSEQDSEERRPEHARTAAARAAAVLTDARARGRRCRGIVVSGGHTASCLADALGAEAIAPIEELQPLCPLGVLRGGEWDGTRIATKGGLVGSERTLLELVEAVRKEAPR